VVIAVLLFLSLTHLGEGVQVVTRCPPHGQHLNCPAGAAQAGCEEKMLASCKNHRYAADYKCLPIAKRINV
jgi:hypothetical protein